MRNQRTISKASMLAKTRRAPPRPRKRQGAGAAHTADPGDENRGCAQIRLFVFGYEAEVAGRERFVVEELRHFFIGLRTPHGLSALNQ
jgi:hypothetical protein